MKMLVLASLPFIAGVQLVNSQAVNSTWWPCQSITPEPNVDLDKIVGVWYAQEIFTTNKIERTVCVGAIFSRTPEGITSRDFINDIEFGVSSGSNTIFNIADPVSNPGNWDHRAENTSVIVVDQAADGSTLTIYGCHHRYLKESTAVFSRSLHLNDSQIEAVNNRLRTAGVNIDHAIRVISGNCTDVSTLE